LVYYLDNSRKGDDEASPTKKVKSEDSQENTGMLTSVFLCFLVHSALKFSWVLVKDMGIT